MNFWRQEGESVVFNYTQLTCISSYPNNRKTKLIFIHQLTCISSYPNKQKIKSIPNYLKTQRRMRLTKLYNRTEFHTRKIGRIQLHALSPTNISLDWHLPSRAPNKHVSMGGGWPKPSMDPTQKKIEHGRWLGQRAGTAPPECPSWAVLGQRP